MTDRSRLPADTGLALLPLDGCLLLSIPEASDGHRESPSKTATDAECH